MATTRLWFRTAKESFWMAGRKYAITFAKGQVPPAGAFWSVTNYQDQFLIPNTTKFFCK
jgi:hypothetical protein